MCHGPVIATVPPEPATSSPKKLQNRNFPVWTPAGTGELGLAEDVLGERERLTFERETDQTAATAAVVRTDVEVGVLAGLGVVGLTTGLISRSSLGGDP